MDESISTDIDGASDIISQEDIDSLNTSGPRIHHNTEENETSAPPEWSDPWSSDQWKNVSWGEPNNHNPSRIESSFESLQFTPVLKTTGEEGDVFHISDAFGVPFDPTSFPRAAASSSNSPSKSSKRSTTQSTGSPKNASKETKIKVGVIQKERLSIVFDDSSEDPVCKVIGSIHVKPTTRKISSFSLTIRDRKAHVEHWDDQNNRCLNITAGVPHLALDRGDQVFSISLKRGHQQDPEFDSPVVSYTCIPRLRPMPMLLKTKIHKKSNRCRLGIRIRANPQNTYILTSMIILIIVPLDLDGANVTMSRKGGIWDEMKRSIIWNIAKLDPGEIVDIQAQFKKNTEGGGVPPGNSEYFEFPVLVRCNGDTSFSKIELNTDFHEDGSPPVGLEVERSATILYRKVGET